MMVISNNQKVLVQLNFSLCYLVALLNGVPIRSAVDRLAYNDLGSNLLFGMGSDRSFVIRT